MKKILIMDDKEDLLHKLQTTITMFDVLTTKTVEGAVKILESEDISFFVVDLDLGYEKTGEVAYSLIFSKGRSIPAIVLTGKEVPPQMREYLMNMGFSDILSKNDPSGRMSDAIESAAKRILESCAERILQIRKNVNRLEIGGKPLSYNGELRSIEEWIDSISNCNHIADDMKEEKELKQLIIKICNAIRRRVDDYDYPHIEEDHG